MITKDSHVIAVVTPLEVKEMIIDISCNTNEISTIDGNHAFCLSNPIPVKSETTAESNTNTLMSKIYPHPIPNAANHNNPKKPRKETTAPMSAKIATTVKIVLRLGFMDLLISSTCLLANKSFIQD